MAALRALSCGFSSVEGVIKYARAPRITRLRAVRAVRDADPG